MCDPDGVECFSFISINIKSLRDSFCLASCLIFRFVRTRTLAYAMIVVGNDYMTTQPWLGN